MTMMGPAAVMEASERARQQVQAVLDSIPGGGEHTLGFNDLFDYGTMAPAVKVSCLSCHRDLGTISARRDFLTELRVRVGHHVWPRISWRA